MSVPNEIIVAQDINAAPLKANFDYLSLKAETNESLIENLNPSAAQYDNGVFSGGLIASQSGTNLTYTAGLAIVNFTNYYKSTLTQAFAGEAADTYYVEMSADGTVDIYTSTDSSRTNLNTVVWNGSGFTSVGTADRTVLYGDAQFVVLAGRTGGQTVKGGTATGEHLVLESTNHGTKGTVKIKTASMQNKLTDQTGAALTLDTTHSLIVCNTTSNAITLTLPDANTVIGQVYDVYVKTVTSSNDVTIACAAGDTFNLNGDNRITLTEEDFVQIVALDASRWYIRINHNAVLSTV